MASALNDGLYIGVRMILYDSNANKTGMVCKFHGNRLTDMDSTIYQSFSKAKKAALQDANRRLKELQDDIRKLEETTESNCILIRNPFTGYLPKDASINAASTGPNCAALLNGSP
jgi:hypothetical protein